MKVSELTNKEAEYWKGRFNGSVRLCKAIVEYYDYIDQIKELISLDDLTGASQLFDELSYQTQKVLMAAPLHGGPFTTKERGLLKSVWKVSLEDL